ncbi:MAG TPA: uroporphyrinogen-III synthase [Ramlibacter sp.]|nr:uroporphyrinogen-III synthase [Ramlibacter sp.]
MRVFVTRPESEARRWVDELRQRGIDALSFPLIAIESAPQSGPVRKSWALLASYRAVMFVSGNAVRHFFSQRPAGAPWPQRTRAWATGGGTSEALLEAGVARSLVDSPPPQSAQFDSETLWQQVAGQVIPGDAVLIVRGGDASGQAAGRDWLADRLAAAGARVDTVVAYVRGVPELDADQLAIARAGAIDGAWLLSSSQAIAHLQALLPAQDWHAARAVATHPRIAHAARRAGFGVVCESRPSVEAVVAALESFG